MNNYGRNWRKIYDATKTTQSPRDWGLLPRRIWNNFRWEYSGHCSIQCHIELTQLFEPRAAKLILNTRLWCIFCNKELKCEMFCCSVFLHGPCSVSLWSRGFIIDSCWLSNIKLTAKNCTGFALIINDVINLPTKVKSFAHQCIGKII